MSAVAKPKLTPDGDLMVIPTDVGSVLVKCELVDPPSRRGQTVYVYFDGDTVTQMMKECRSAARAIREIGEYA